MSDVSTAPVTKAAKSVAEKAAKNAVEQTAAAVSEVAPVVSEVVEIAAVVPARIVMKTPLVVALSLTAGTALGATGLWAFNKFRNRSKLVGVTDKPADLEEKVTAETEVK